MPTSRALCLTLVLLGGCHGGKKESCGQTGATAPCACGDLQGTQVCQADGKYAACACAHPGIAIAEAAAEEACQCSDERCARDALDEGTKRIDDEVGKHPLDEHSAEEIDAALSNGDACLADLSATAGESLTGLPECDRFIQNYRRCLDSMTLDPATRQAGEDAIKQMVDAYRQTAAPETRDAIEQACRDTDAQMRQAMQGQCTW